MINLPNLTDADVKGKRVLLRCDFDIPLIEARGPATRFPPASARSRFTDIRAVGSPSTPVTPHDFEIADDTRLVSSISTIEYLQESGAIVIAVGHLGRPGGQFQIDESKFSLLPVAKWFAQELAGASFKKTHIGGFSAWKLKENFYILENLRFDKGEENNDANFSHKLAYIADIYVNEAFGSSHRAHASIVGVANLLPHFAGFHFQKEIKILTNIIESPRKPFTFVVGGAKIETKLPLISKMHRFADYVLVGGELAEQDKVLIEEQHENITTHKAMLLVADLNSDKTDITEMSLENFIQIVSRSKCIIWNGPMGNLEKGFYGTSLKLAEAIEKSSAYKVVGGGDTIGLLNKHNLLDKFNFVSVGGGAMLEFLSGETLPGLQVLQN